MFLKVSPQDPSFEKKFEEAQINYNELCLEHKLPLLPYLIICGPLQHVERAYVILGSYKHSIEGENCALKAVQKCYQAVKALNKTFPIAATDVWQFNALYLYKYKAGGESDNVLRLIDDLKKIKLKNEEIKDD